MEHNEVTAKHGQKMIGFEVKFYTNDIADEAGKVKQGVMWPNGIVLLKRNDTHEIIGEQRPFNSIAEIPIIMEEMMITAGLKLKPTRNLHKLIFSG